MFLSIFLATCRPDNIVNYLKNLAETADDPKSFEVLIKVDEGDEATANAIASVLPSLPLNVTYKVLPRLDGYYSLDVGYNQLLSFANPESYFCWLLTDEIRFKTKGWDTLLKKYVKYYPDDIFRLKLSMFQLKNYYDFFECLTSPDNYALTTKKWLELTGGWGYFWGPDSWHQCVDYFLGLAKDSITPHGIFRSFPIYEVELGGQEAGEGITNPESLMRRAKMIHMGWNKHSTLAAQENFKSLALRLKAHIIAKENNLNEYVLEEDHLRKLITLLPEKEGKPIATWSYALPKNPIKIYIGKKKFELPRILMRIWFAAIAPYPTLKRLVRLILRTKPKLYNACREIKITITKTISMLYFILKLPFKLVGFPLNKIKNKCISLIKRVLNLTIKNTSLLINGKPKNGSVKTVYFYDGFRLMIIEQK